MEVAVGSGVGVDVNCGVGVGVTVGRAVGRRVGEGAGEVEISEVGEGAASSVGVGVNSVALFRLRFRPKRKIKTPARPKSPTAIIMIGTTNDFLEIFISGAGVSCSTTP